MLGHQRMQPRYTPQPLRYPHTRQQTTVLVLRLDVVMVLRARLRCRRERVVCDPLPLTPAEPTNAVR